jgi:uncharacterized protein YukE
MKQKPQKVFGHKNNDTIFMKKGIIFLLLAIFLVSAVSFAIAEQQNRGDNKGDNNLGERDRNRSGNENWTNNRTQNWTPRVGENSEGGMRAAVAGMGGLKQAIVNRFMENHPVITQKFLEEFNNTDKSHVFENLDRARFEKCLNNTEACKEKIKNWTVKEFKVKDFLKKRNVDEKKLIKARDEFLKAQNKYLEAKNHQLKARDEFLGLKLRLAECKNTSKNCSGLENQTFTKAQEDLNQIADKLINYLDKVKSKVEEANNLNQTEADQATQTIDSMISKLNDAKDAVDAADTKAELQAAGKQILDVWKDMDFKALFYAEKVVNAGVGEIFSRSELLEKRLDVVIQKLENKSINVTGLQDLLDNFSAKIDDARTKMADANKLFAQAKDLREKNDTAGAKDKLEQAKNLTLEAHQDLKDAHTILMDLVHQINQKGESFNPDEIKEDDTVEVVQDQNED